MSSLAFARSSLRFAPVSLRSIKRLAPQLLLRPSAARPASARSTEVPSLASASVRDVLTCRSPRSSSGGSLHHDLQPHLATGLLVDLKRVRPIGFEGSEIRRGLGLLVVLVLAVLVTGCVSPQEKAAEPILEVPYGLLGPTSTTTEPPPELEGQFELDLYFLAEEDDSLWRVTRSREQRPGIQEALELLVAGPTEAESELLPVRARLSESLNPIAGQPIGGLLSITVSDEAQFRENTNNRLATQVIVCTMTQFDTVDAVELRDTTGPIPLSGIDAETIGERATRANYNDCEAGDLADFSLEDTVDGATDSPTEGEDESVDQ